MSKLYIIDTSQAKGGKSPVVFFDTIPGLVAYLDGACKRRFGLHREEYMVHVESLGFGADDPTGQSFFEQMEQYFQMGVIRGDSVPVKCNVFEADAFSQTREAHGN